MSPAWPGSSGALSALPPARLCPWTRFPRRPVNRLHRGLAFQRRSVARRHRGCARESAVRHRQSWPRRCRALDGRVAAHPPRAGSRRRRGHMYESRFGDEERIRSDGFEVGPLRSRRYVGRVRELRQRVRASAPDVLHCALFSSDMVGRVAGWRTGAVVVSSFVNTPYEPERFRLGDIRVWKLRAVQAADAATAHLVDHFHAISNGTADSNTRAFASPRARHGGRARPLASRARNVECHTTRVRPTSVGRRRHLQGRARRRAPGAPEAPDRSHCRGRHDGRSGTPATRVHRRKAGQRHAGA